MEKTNKAVLGGLLPPQTPPASGRAVPPRPPTSWGAAPPGPPASRGAAPPGPPAIYEGLRPSNSPIFMEYGMLTQTFGQKSWSCEVHRSRILSVPQILSMPQTSSASVPCRARLIRAVPGRATPPRNSCRVLRSVPQKPGRAADGTSLNIS